ncbi:MAG: hypothetical protein IJD40_01780 [Lachnospiraceae bacterium]|nr:hypothetical protein [Lachnospiraceae bacterium]
MYECSNCSSGLKFNIALQQLVCEHCNSQYDPYEFDGLHAAEEDNSFEVTMFTCSQCGGELYTTDTTVAGFCSFCGSTTVLNSRIDKELRPDYIIPFQKTKVDCKKEYMKLMRLAIFAPKELKDEKCIDGFRGIYMPYWLYDVKHQQNLSLPGKTEKRRGDYIYTSHYRLYGNLDAHYDGISYDGSSSFADNISGKLAPFDVKAMKRFTPTFLSGFYADTADVDADIYSDNAIEIADRHSTQFVQKQSTFRKYNVEETDIRSDLYGVMEKTSRAMFPVWFMSYRNNDRVAYATVNGQTGKVVADLPVDIKKYMLGTLILAIPIFILLNLIFTVTPSVLLAVVAFIAAFVSVLYTMEMKEIVKRESYEDDEGMQYKNSIKDRFGRNREAAATQDDTWVAELERQKRIKKPEKKMPLLLKLVLIYFAASFVIPIVMLIFGFLGSDSLALTVNIVALVVSVTAFVKSMSFEKKINEKGKVTVKAYCMIAITVAIMITCLDPVHDLYYYVGACFSLVAVFVTLIDLIKKYNILATRKLPQFDYQGGDDNA